MPSLKESLDIVEKRLAKALLNDGNLERMKAVAARLPPVHRAGFEYQFLNPGRGLDFQQGLTVAASDFSRTNRKIITDRHSTEPPLGFLEQISDLGNEALGCKSDYGHCLQQIWLEFDCGLAEPQSFPSVFLGLHYDPDLWSLAFQNIQQAHSLLGGRPLSLDSADCLQNTLKISSAYQGASHIGFMLGREIDALRIVLPMPGDSQGVSLLKKQLGIQNDHPQLSEQFEKVEHLFPESRLCLDIHQGRLSTHGYECFFRPAYSVQKHFLDEASILRELEKMGICSAVERGIFSDWAGQLFPPSCSPAWPEDLLISSLLAPEDRFTQMETGLSHIKISFGRKNRVITKIYFGYRESWVADSD
jgi:hypothetical protein